VEDGSGSEGDSLQVGGVCATPACILRMDLNGVYIGVAWCLVVEVALREGWIDGT
jgi:hypothetical protein